MTQDATQAPEATTDAAAVPTGQRTERQHGPADIRTWRERLSCSRNALAEITGISVSRIWASEQPTKEISGDHYRVIVATLENIEKNGLPEHLRTKQVGKAPVIPRQRIAEVNELLSTTSDLKTLKEVRAVIEQVQAVLTELQSL